MKNAHYRDYSVDDFTQDELFRDWVINRNSLSEVFWLEWLAENVDCTDKVQLARAFLLSLEEKDTGLSPMELEDIFTRIVQDSQPIVIPFWQRPTFRVAAAILLMLGMGYAAFTYVWKPNTGQLTHQAPASLDDISPALVSDVVDITNETTQPRTLILQDSSRIVLYPKGKLRYPKQFDKAKREVYLTGQAFFSVKRNPKKPFWVYTDQISTQVLGTSFLVTADASHAKVAVHSGRVSVYMRKDVQHEQKPGKHESAGVVLTPNQQVLFSTTEKRLVKSVVEKPIVIQKVPVNDYIFDEAPVTEVFTLLEKTYGLPVVYDASSLENCYLTANLTGESLFDKLNLICKITRSSYELVDGQIVIYSKGCEK
ncbi:MULTISPECIES: FecR family protein [unclassified Spirosoma]|uniref:FecR family protein n=1 Tax=unclassified Spirosoma TaxID=2621999 RepID=UPI000969085E|nr:MULTISPECIES: FecR family protein [unclassified Spirosoma]MBN8820910.1 FecR family protein [Spirosoma sp.]OJW75926.1 MAG: iron dicitrate transport regulator FecR [Spirosoma sp. 48-14]